MQDFAEIKHPLKRDGRSAADRTLKALSPAQNPIDGRDWKELLMFLYRMASRIKYYDTELNENDWRAFLKNSTPIQLALVSQFELENLESVFEELDENIVEFGDFESVNAVIDFILEVIFLAEDWRKDFSNDQTGYGDFLNKFIQSNLKFIVKDLSAIINAAGRWGYQSGRNLFTLTSWGLTMPDFLLTDSNLSQVKISDSKRLEIVRQKLRDIFRLLFKNLTKIVKKAPDFIEESISENQRHQPYLGLLYAFIRLWRILQTDLNGLTQKHLDFFYRKVLCIKEQPAVPDKAHLIFELANRITEEALEKGFRFKGKDKEGNNILFELDRQLVIRKAQVADLKTLFLDTISAKYTVPANSNTNTPAETKIACDVVECVFKAEPANSADGLGEPFQGVENPTWKTLGWPESKKRITPTTDKLNPYYQQHPFAPFGFLLASQVLFLNEGRREIIITITGDLTEVLNTGDPEADKLKEALEAVYVTMTEEVLKNAEDFGVSPFIIEYLKGFQGHAFTRTQFQELIDNRLPIDERDALDEQFFDVLDDLGGVISNNNLKYSRAFDLCFSGEKEWIVAVTDVNMPEALTINLNVSDLSNVVLTFAYTLLPEAEKVVCYNPEVYKADYETELPVAKIALNPSVKYSCYEFERISPYHTMRCFKVKNVLIDVNVTGVCNLLIQNDDSILDPAKPFTPFGPIPKVNNNFYIGSAEVFSKTLKNLDLHLCWKDLPDDFAEHYEGYHDLYMMPSPNPGDIEYYTADLYRLNNAVWDEKNPVLGTPVELFTANASPPPNYDKLTTYNVPVSGNDKLVEGKELAPYDFNSVNGFLRLELTPNDFLHDKYSEALTLQMLAIGLAQDNQTVAGAVYLPGSSYINNIVQCVADASAAIQQLNAQVAALNTAFDNEFTTAGSPPSAAFSDGLINSIVSFTSTSLLIATNNMNEEIEGNYFNVSDLLADCTLVLSFVDAILNNGIILVNNNIDLPVNSPDFTVTNGIITQIFSLITQIQTKLNAAITGLNNFGSPANQDRIPIPKPPYTPTLQKVTIDYRACAENTQEDVNLIHLHPYEKTYETIPLPSVTNPQSLPYLIPKFTDEGHLFIGVKDLEAGSVLDLLFQMTESTADPDFDKANVKWYYLKKNKWAELRPEFEILSDETNGLIQSGIVQIKIPWDITDDNSILPKELFWLRVSAPSDVAAIAETGMIHAQAARVTFIDEGLNLERLAEPLAAKTIAKPVQAVTTLKGMTQQYDSFGGKAPEADSVYYRRVSERLRHKGRGITLFDYETLVLQQFPQIFKAKCITHTMGRKGKNVTDYELSPGFVTVAVIPDVSQLKIENKLEPKATLALLESIEKYLKQRISPFIRLKVLNPIFEYIGVRAKIKFREGYDESFYSKRLETDLQEFLAPWAFGDSGEISFGGKIAKSAILNFIEKREYVDYLTDLKMLDKDGTDQVEIFAESARSVLTTGTHRFEPITEDECTTENETSPDMQGLGHMSIGSGEFKIPGVKES